MTIKCKILGFAIIAGFAIAASVEIREGFDLIHPVIFYGFHGTFILAIIIAVLLAHHRKQINAFTIIQTGVTLVLFYGIAATRASIAPIAVAITGMGTILIWVITQRHSI